MARWQRGHYLRLVLTQLIQIHVRAEKEDAGVPEKAVGLEQAHGFGFVRFFHKGGYRRRN